MDITVQTYEYNPNDRPHPWGDRPEHLPIAATVWDKAKYPNVVNSTFVINALYEAVKQLEANQRDAQS